TEDGLAGANGFVAGAGATGAVALNVNWGADNDTQGNGAGDTFGRALSFLAGGVPAVTGENGAALSSGGVALQYVVTTLANGGELLTAYKGDARGDEARVFTVTLDPTSAHGSYSFNLLGTLDHATGSDSVALTFAVQAADADGDTVDTSFTVNVADDGPVVGVADSGIVDEDGGLAGGNPGPLFGGGDALLVPTNASGDLSILWGSDDGNRNVDGGFTGTQVAGDRSVVFGADVVAALEGQDLSSNGVELVYTLSGNGTVLTATAGDGGAVVFTVSLSDQGTGSWAFDLKGVLDHPVAGTEDDIVLTFGYVARDGDGDSATGAFAVSVDDDTPVALGTVFPRYVEEEQLAGGNEDTTPGTITGDLDYDLGIFGSDYNVTTQQASASLNIGWGADNGNANVDGGFTGTQVAGDRSVVFADGTVAGLEARNLSSNGVELVYTLSGNGTVVTATAGAGGAVVFTVSLSDQGAGSYDFVLSQTLDHPAGGGENEIGFEFDFVARDGDGDPVGGGFEVRVLDDTIVQGSAVSVSVDEDNLSGGNVDDGYAGDIVGASASNGGTLGVSWGTDDNVHGESAGDTFGRSVNFVKASGSTALLGEGAVTASQLGLSGSLSSDGVTLSYQIVKTMTGVGGSWNGGYELIAYKAGGDYTDATDQVFRVTLDPTSTNGSYRFDLLGNLDHSASPANSENDLKLTFGFRATDADGDTASRATFSVTVDDDGPVSTGDGNHNVGLDEDDIVAISGVQPAGTDGTDPIVATGNITKVNFGADGFGSMEFSGSFTVPNENSGTLVAGGAGQDSGMTSGGQAVFFRLSSDGLTIEGYVPGRGDEPVFTAVLNGTDRGYTVTLLGNIDHQPGDTGRGAAQSLNLAVRASDGDGDYVDVNLSVRITDDAPVARYSGRLTLQETAKADGS
ncbi:MAG: hypothetical protein WBB07_29765, partial [Mycobacterium sp.]